MKNKKNIFSIFVCIVMLLSLTGCGNKTAISSNEFSLKAQNHNYIVNDVTAQFSIYGVIESATIARSSNNWQVEFYVLTNDAEATKMFNTNQKIFEAYKGNSSSESSSNVGNYSVYTLTSSGYYMHLCRVDNTLLYVKANDTYKKTIKSFVKELGY